jgi:hypothetical protein
MRGKWGIRGTGLTPFALSGPTRLIGLKNMLECITAGLLLDGYGQS